MKVGVKLRNQSLSALKWLDPTDVVAGEKNKHWALQKICLFIQCSVSQWKWNNSSTRTSH